MKLLKDFIKISKGKKSNELPYSKFLPRYIQIDDLRNDNCLKSCEETNNLVRCDKNDILIAWDGANAGTIGYNLEGAIGSTIAKLTPNEKVYSPYLGRFLQSNFKELRRNCTGATIPHISKNFLLSLRIPLPDLPTQRKIVAALDKADAIRKRNQQMLKKYDQLAQSVFLEMFGDPVRNEKGWEVMPLRECLSFLTSGSRGWAKYYSRSGRIFLRIQNIGFSRLKTKDLVFVQTPQSAEARRTLVQEGDIILSITADLGRTAVIPPHYPPAHINQHLAILRLKPDYNPYFVSEFMSSPGGKIQVKKYNKGGVKAGFNFDDIKSFEIINPSIDLQNKFAKTREKIESQKQKLIQEIEKSENLFQSLLQRAFKGELFKEERVEV